MPTKQQIITIGVLCVVALGLGYWSGPFKKDSGQRAEVVAPLPVRPNPIIEKAIREELEKPTDELTKADLEKVTMLQLDDKQLTSVKGLENLTQLRTLFLYKNQLTSVKVLEKLTRLEALTLHENRLTSVKGLEKLTKLKKLHLSYNQLTDVKGLERLTQLTRLSLTNNPDLTKAQIDELQKALPNCKIISNPKK